MTYKYKFNGLVCPYLMQGVFGVFLVVIWTIAVTSGAPWFALVMTALISCFIIWFVYTGYPAGFGLSQEGLTLVFSMGTKAFFEWKDVKQLKVTGPVAVIEVNKRNWASRVFNKYLVFLWLLNDREEFRRTLDERIPA